MSKIRVDEIVDIVDEGSPDLPHGATSVEPVAASQVATKSYVDNSLNGTWSNSVTDSAPTNPAIGSFWVDTSAGTLNVLKCWNGSAWEEFSGMAGGIAYEMGIADPTLVSPTNYSGYPDIPYIPSSSEITSIQYVGGFTTGAPMPVASRWQDITYGGGKFVAISDVSTIHSGDGQVFTGEQVMWSSDGFNWVVANQSENAEWKGIAYGNGKYVAVSAGPIGGNNYFVGNTRVMWSTDAITWNAASALSVTVESGSKREMKWADIAYGEPNGQPTFVAVANMGTGNHFMHSSDGINWTGAGLAPGQVDTGEISGNPDGEYDDIRWTSVAYGGGKFVAIASDDNTNRCKYSTDGIIWHDGAIGLPYRNFKAVTYGEPNGQPTWVAVAEKTSTISGGAFYSYDAINWFQSTSVWNNGWVNVTYGEPNGQPRFMAVADYVHGSDNGNKAMYSDNGIDWIALPGAAPIQPSNGAAMGALDFGPLTYGAGKFVKIATGSGWSYDTNIIGTSYDGTSWRNGGADITFANDKVYMADTGDEVRRETLSTVLTGNETLQDLDSLTTGTVAASGTLSPGMSGNTINLTNITGAWVPGMKFRSLRTLSQVNDEAVKSYDPGILGSIPAVIPNAGAVSGWGTAEWHVAEDSAFTTNLQTSKTNIVQEQLQNGPSDIVLEPNKDYFMRIKYSSLDPAISFSEFSRTYTFKTETVTFPDPSVTTTYSTGDTYDLQPRFNCYGGGCSQYGPNWWDTPGGNLVVTNNMYAFAPGGDPGYHMAAFKPVEVTSSLRVWVNTGGSGVAVNAVTWEGVATPEDVLSWPDLNNEFGVPGWVTLPVPVPFTLHSVGRDQQMADTYRGWFRLGAIEVDGHVLVEGGVIPGTGPVYTYSDGRWLGSI